MSSNFHMFVIIFMHNVEIHQVRRLVFDSYQKVHSGFKCRDYILGCMYNMHLNHFCAMLTFLQTVWPDCGVVNGGCRARNSSG